MFLKESVWWQRIPEYSEKAVFGSTMTGCSADLKTNKQKNTNTHTPQPNNMKSSKLSNYFWSSAAGWTRYAQFSYQFYFFQGIQGTAVWTANWVLPPTNGYLKPREKPISARISFYKAINTGYSCLYPQFKRWISVRLGRILVSIAWETTGHFSWAMLNHPTLNWPENWGSVHFFPLPWNPYYFLSKILL